MDRLDILANAVQRLSLATSLEEVQIIVRTAARRLTGADGATFVLRDHDKCFYADEDAIEPLWKGLRFPLESCISGWAMLNRLPTAIPDIYVDDRIPHEAYRPTFVKSLMMVPIRRLDPIGAIGMYWADRHEATDQEMGLAQALADSTSVTLDALQIRDRLSLAVQLSETDPLTTLPNRRTWDAALAAMQNRGGSACLAILDLDHFKAYNDKYGHSAGDRLLADCAMCWRDALRPGDLLVRLGGEEFGLLLGDCTLEAAIEVGERLREATPDATSVSLGIAEWDGREDGIALTDRADEALYEAKAAGRNRAAVAA